MEMKERQSKEESQVLWKLELESAKNLTLSKAHARLVEVVTKCIDDYTLTYEEYLEDIVAYLKSSKDMDNPKVVIEDMCNQLIEKYNGLEEVRSEQD